MKTYSQYSVLALLFALLCSSGKLSAQTSGEYKRQLVFGIDDDFINFHGQGTDEAYSAGTFIDFRYGRSKPGFFPERWAPKAGPGAVTTYGFGLSQLIYTPNDLLATQPINNDFPYGGALISNFSAWSYNPVKKFGFQSRIVAGVMGPASFASQVQIFAHHITPTEVPKGWDNQLPNDILLNLEIGVEKQLTGNNWIEVIGGGKVYAGSMMDALEASLFIRTGKMNPWFNGFMSHTGTPSNTTHKARWQIYGFAKPSVQVVPYDAMLEGGIILHKPKVVSPPVNRFRFEFDYGLVLSHSNFAISLNQKGYSPWIKGLGYHLVGNVSLYFQW